MTDHISEKNARNAADNLQKKINYIKEVLQAANGRDYLDENVLTAIRLCPSSQNQFNAMRSAGLPSEFIGTHTFSSNAAKTLRDDTASTATVEQLIRLRGNILLHGKLPFNKLERIADLKRVAKFNSMLLDITQAENDDLRAKIEGLENQLKERQQKFEADLREFEEENSRLRKLVAVHNAKTTSNVRSLKHSDI